MHNFNKFIVIALLGLYSCFFYPVHLYAFPMSAHRKELATKSGFKEQTITTSFFQLYSFLKVADPAKPLKVYIEGDGYAWVSKSKLSLDPTPRKDLVFNWVMSDNTSSNVAYLARPCQYVDKDAEKHFHPKYWSSARFSAEAIDSTNEAIDKLKQMCGASSVELIGYSGGGAVAVLVAAKRKDVIKLTTVAGNLDHRLWATHHRISYLWKSLNPADVAMSVASIEQVHYVGDRDKVMPAIIAESFARNSGNPSSLKIIHVQGAEHEKGWDKIKL